LASSREQIGNFRCLLKWTICGTYDSNETKERSFVAWPAYRKSKYQTGLALTLISCVLAANSKPKRQVHLHQVELVDRIHLRNILAAATGAQLVVDAGGIAVSDGCDEIVGETIGNGRVNAL
jgi:hypothetical protein